MTSNPNSDDIQVANDPTVEILPAAQRLELSDLRLLESASSLKLGAELQSITSINQSITIGVTRASEPNRIAFQFMLSLSGTSQKEEVIRISATYGEAYAVKSDEPISDDVLKKFGEIVGINMVWPYWREFVQSITTRMSLPPLTLPLMRPGLMQFNKDTQNGALPEKVKKRTKKSR